jgi:peptidoglycan/xylan/chitin deacetylase (PgdA/CDA1 family)
MSYVRLLLCILSMLSAVSIAAQEAPKTEITKWPDGKLAAVAITYDDSTINQFRVALPLMNDRGLVGTFFVITAQIPGSKKMPTFVGRPIMEILKESATVPTSAANVFERTSMLRYLGEIQRNEIVLATRIQPSNLAGVDAALSKLRESGKTYAVDAIPYVPVRSEEAGRPVAAGPGSLSWNEMRKVASQGHEIANHAVSHARLPSLDEANIVYEVDKAKKELSREMGEKHLFSIEAPYGIDDERVRKVLINRFPCPRARLARAGAMRSSSTTSKVRTTRPGRSIRSSARFIHESNLRSGFSFSSSSRELVVWSESMVKTCSITMACRTLKPAGSSCRRTTLVAGSNTSR